MKSPLGFEAVVAGGGTASLKSDPGVLRDYMLLWLCHALIVTPAIKSIRNIKPYGAQDVSDREAKMCPRPLRCGFQYSA